MRFSRHHNYYVYIITNKNKTVLYTGITNNLLSRLYYHQQNSLLLNPSSFTAKYKAYFLLYYEHFEKNSDAIAREKQIKSWKRSKKEQLINSLNPEWKFLNDEIF